MLLRLLRIVTCWRFCVHLGQFCSGAMFRWPKHAIRFWHAASHSKESESQSKTVIAQQLMMTYVMTTRPGVQLYMKYWLYLSHQCWPKTRAESMNAKKYSWHEINRKLTYIPYWQRSNPLDKGTKKKATIIYVGMAVMMNSSCACAGLSQSSLSSPKLNCLFVSVYK